MKIRLFTLLSFVSLSNLFAQVVMTNNIPTKLPVGSDVEVEVKINKGSITNFTKYHMDVPAGVEVSEIDSKTGNFTFENNRAKIVWVSVPGEPEFTVKFKVHINTQAPAAATINQKFYFLDAGNKKEVEATPIAMEFGNGTPVTKNPNISATPAPAPTPVNPTAVVTAKTETKVAEPTPMASIPVVSQGLVYRIQIASSPTDPGRAKYSALGSNCEISKEDGNYKVLYGSFKTKEEALKAKDDLALKGFNGFLVKYQNGVRVK
jgi:cell division septation protein DedD